MFNLLFRLSKQSLIYGLGALASYAIGIFLIPVYTRYLNPTDYGVLEIFGVSQEIISIILLLGFSSALLFSYFKSDTEKEREKVISTALIFLTINTLCFTLVLTLTANNFSLLLFNSSQYTFYFQIIFMTIFFNTSIQIPMAIFRAKDESRKYVLFTLLGFIITVALNLYFVVGLHMGVLGILEGSLIASILIYILLVFLTAKQISIRFSINRLKEMLGFGLPLVPVALGSWILTVSDRYFLQFFSTPTELGLYSLGYKFGLLIQGLIVVPFQLAWLPFVFSTAKEKNAKDVYPLVFTYFAFGSIFIALGLSLLCKEILLIMVTPLFYGAYKVVPLIALSYIFYGFYFCLNVGIYLEKKTGYLSFIVGAGALINLFLNYFLIPSYGMMGAAVATLFSYLSLPVGAYLIAQRYYTIQYEWGRLARIFIAAALVYTGGIFITHNSMIVASLFKGISLLGFPMLLYLFNFFQPEEIQKTKEVLGKAWGYIIVKLKRIRISREKRDVTR